MTINWTQDEHGNRDWTHGEWSIRIWAPSPSGLTRDKGLNRISVAEAPRRRWQVYNEVDVTDEGIRTLTAGPSWTGGTGWSGGSFTIPWVVLEAIFDARKIVTQELERE